MEKQIPFESDTLPGGIKHNRNGRGVVGPENKGDEDWIPAVAIIRKTKSDCEQDRVTYRFLVGMHGVRGNYNLVNSNCRIFAHGCMDEIIERMSEITDGGKK
ncbi:MAG: hypothetical protein LBJ00_11150 [Planctomycetaceae bacterium]|jgi:hypothetical protein|nr:hypothetical protein [Planctomycetaceae bacterium]